MRCFENAGLTRLLQQVGNEGNDVSTTVESQIPPNLFVWGGRFNNFPETFDFPPGGVLQAWQWWFLGNPSQQYRPLKELRTTDLSTTNKKKRWSDYKYVIQTLIILIDTAGCLNDDANRVDEVNRMYMAIEEQLKTIIGRDKRLEQLRWPTVARILREKRLLDYYRNTNVQQQ